MIKCIIHKRRNVELNTEASALTQNCKIQKYRHARAAYTHKQICECLPRHQTPKAREIVKCSWRDFAIFRAAMPKHGELGGGLQEKAGMLKDRRIGEGGMEGKLKEKAGMLKGMKGWEKRGGKEGKLYGKSGI